MIIRTLKENEIGKWIDFVWTIFPYESRKYFQNQWDNDPWKHITTVMAILNPL